MTGIDNTVGPREIIAQPSEYSNNNNDPDQSSPAQRTANDGMKSGEVTKNQVAPIWYNFNTYAKHWNQICSAAGISPRFRSTSVFCAPDIARNGENCFVNAMYSVIKNSNNQHAPIYRHMWSIFVGVYILCFIVTFACVYRERLYGRRFYSLSHLADDPKTSMILASVIYVQNLVGKTISHTVSYSLAESAGNNDQVVNLCLGTIISGGYMVIGATMFFRSRSHANVTQQYYEEIDLRPTIYRRYSRFECAMEDILKIDSRIGVRIIATQKAMGLAHICKMIVEQREKVPVEDRPKVFINRWERLMQIIDTNEFSDETFHADKIIRDLDSGFETISQLVKNSHDTEISKAEVVKLFVNICDNESADDHDIHNEAHKICQMIWLFSRETVTHTNVQQGDETSSNGRLLLKTLASFAEPNYIDQCEGLFEKIRENQNFYF